MKPYSIQAPEEIAKEYGGNKQKIAAAAQSGLLDPTAAILAGMFIDRMRNAQIQEQAAPPTVAQQVLGPPQPPPSPAGGMPPGGGAGPPPPMGGPGGAPPMGGPAGPSPGPPMGGLPPPDMPPQGGIPQPPPGMAAGGGLDSIPVNDNMFGDYADGGLVAFAEGGSSNAGVQAFNNFMNALDMQETGGRYGIPNAQGSGALGRGQLMPATAKTLAAKLGITYDPKLQAGNSPEARKQQDALFRAAAQEAWDYGGGDTDKAAAYYFAGPNRKGWGANTKKYQSDIRRRLGMTQAPGKEEAPLPEENTDTREGRRMTLDEYLTRMDQREAALPTKRRGELEARIESERDPEKIAAQKKKDIGYALMAAAPSLLTSGPLLAAAPAALAKFGESYKTDDAARAAAERKTFEDLASLEEGQRKDMRTPTQNAIELYTGDLKVEGDQKAREQQQAQFEAKLAADREALNKELANRLQVAGIQASGKDKSDLLQMVEARLATLRRDNEQKPFVPVGSKQVKGTYRRDDRYLVDQAFSEVIGERYKSNTTPGGLDEVQAAAGGGAGGGPQGMPQGYSLVK